MISVFLLALAISLSTAPETAQSPPSIELYTMGQGEELMASFGHASLCVRWERSIEDRCFNYGTMDASDPLKLAWGFIRGEANFYVSLHDPGRMLSHYVNSDRSVWVQRLPLSDQEAWRVAELLYEDAKPENRYYQYHHYYENCSTRLRDILDKATNQRLSTRAKSEAWSKTYRSASREGFAEIWWINGLSDLVLGRGADFQRNLYEGMFLPVVLQSEVESEFSVKPEEVYQRVGPALTTESIVPRVAFIVLGLLAAGICALGLRGGKKRRWLLFIGLSFSAFAGFVVWTLAILSPLDMARYNEAVLVVWPIDWALAFLNSERSRRLARLRLGWLTFIALLSLVGILKQPLWQLLAFAALPLLVIAFRGASISSDASQEQ